MGNGLGLFKAKIEYILYEPTGKYVPHYTTYTFYFDYKTGKHKCHSLEGPAMVDYRYDGTMTAQGYYIDGRPVRASDFFKEVCIYMSQVRCPVCRANVTDVISLNVEDKEITCPKCGSPSSTELWKKAYENPAEFFDTLQLCDCGGEIWYTISPGQKSGRLECDRCGKEFPMPNKPKVDEYEVMPSVDLSDSL